MRVPEPRRGFTFVELMIAMSIFAFISLAVITAYLFMGRNLERLMSTQRQDVKARRTILEFSQDVSSANALSSVTSSNLTMTVAPSNTTITYIYDTANATLTRKYGSNTATTLLTGITTAGAGTTNGFNYYDANGTATSNATYVKAVEFSFTTASGNRTSGTQSSYVIVSPRVILKNKALLQ